ncbi:MAG: TIGR03067 domain-containing protein [Pirellulaceae bacterium]|nr:TIGR03067 domain-containing protein [Pirellulaceae bacterium]
MFLALIQVAIADDTSKTKSRDNQDTVNEFQHDGIWKPKGAILAGVFLPPPSLEAITLKIKKNRYEVVVEGEDHSDKGTFTLDKSTTPKRMTIQSESGPNKGKTILAIYEIKNADAMRVCYDLSGKEFPTEFKAPKNTERYVVGYRRQKAEPAASKKQIRKTKSETDTDGNDR